MSEQKGLVTVCVLTYNSAEYVLETLDSIRNQTYENIRLIISDDCSPDNTLEVCTTWLEQNKSRFDSVEMLTVEANTGVTANCNRAVKAAQGRWFKFIAGDDILCPDAIETLVSYGESMTYDKYFIGSYVQPFNENGDLARDPMKEQELTAFGHISSPSGQMELLRFSNPLLAPTVLFPTDVFKRLQFDEVYPFAEDYPMFLNMLAAGYKYINIDQPLVRYRINSTSLSNEGKAERLFPSFYKRKRILEEGLQLPYLGFAERSKINSDYYTRVVFDRLGLNRKNVICKILFSLCLRLNPFYHLGTWSYKNKLRKYRQTSDAENI